MKKSKKRDLFEIDKYTNRVRLNPLSKRVNNMSLELYGLKYNDLKPSQLVALSQKISSKYGRVSIWTKRS